MKDVLKQDDMKNKDKVQTSDTRVPTVTDSKKISITKRSKDREKIILTIKKDKSFINKSSVSEDQSRQFKKESKNAKPNMSPIVRAYKIQPEDTFKMGLLQNKKQKDMLNEKSPVTTGCNTSSSVASSHDNSTYQNINSERESDQEKGRPQRNRQPSLKKLESDVYKINASELALQESSSPDTGQENIDYLQDSTSSDNKVDSDNEQADEIQDPKKHVYDFDVDDEVEGIEKYSTTKKRMEENTKKTMSKQNSKGKFLLASNISMHVISSATPTSPV